MKFSHLWISWIVSVACRRTKHGCCSRSFQWQLPPPSLDLGYTYTGWPFGCPLCFLSRWFLPCQKALQKSKIESRKVVRCPGDKAVVAFPGWTLAGSPNRVKGLCMWMLFIILPCRWPYSNFREKTLFKPFPASGIFSKIFINAKPNCSHCPKKHGCKVVPVRDKDPHEPPATARIYVSCSCIMFSSRPLVGLSTM